MVAGKLPAGGRAGGDDRCQTAVVEAIHTVPGAAGMWDLTVSNLHTFAVGTGDYVVHNCDTAFHDAPKGNNVVYRGLAPGEDTAEGLTARAPDAVDVSPASHVAGKRESPWISTTKSLEVAIQMYGKNGVIAIDLSRLDTRVADLSSGIPGREGQMISNWAARDSEVLIFQHVPPEAILWTWRP